MGQLSRRLSTGVKISSAKNDPAGMSISTKLRFQVEGTKMASQNTMNGISVLQTAEAGLSEVHSILQRMRELAVQSANDTNMDDDREKIQLEMAQLKDEINSISHKTNYNRIDLLNGHAGLKGTSEDVNVIEILGMSDNVIPGNYNLTLDIMSGTVDEPAGFELFNKPKISFVESYKNDMAQDIDRVTITDANNRRMVIDIISGATTVEIAVADNRLVFQTGANKDINVEVSIGEISAKSLGIDRLNVESTEASVDAIKALDIAISRCSEIRSKIGAYQNRFEMINSNLETADITIQTTLAKVFDTDMAYDIAELTRQRIVNQGAISVLGQANQRPQSVLQLIQ